MKFLKFALSVGSVAFSACFLSACGEQAGGGKAAAIPLISISCLTTNCRAAATPAIYVYITTSNCDWAFLNGATASASVNTSTCNSTLGCQANMPGSWTSGADHMATTTIPSGTYTICGHVNYDGTFPLGPGTHDTTIEVDNVSVSAMSSSLILGTGGASGNWQDH